MLNIGFLNLNIAMKFIVTSGSDGMQRYIMASSSEKWSLKVF